VTRPVSLKIFFITFFEKELEVGPPPPVTPFSGARFDPKFLPPKKNAFPGTENLVLG
jgi:hypothetical protein